MRQVPGRTSLLLIGDGRLARHLDHYFQLCELEVSRWSRRHDSFSELPLRIRDCDRVLLAIRDAAIPDFVAKHRVQPGPLWVHFSGSLVAKGCWSAHPLCTFSGPDYEEDFYRSIPFIIESEGPPLQRLIPGLENPSAAIPGASKALYHALCVSAGNFTQLLWLQLFEAFQDRLGLSSDLTIPFLRQTLRSLCREDAGSARTGPLVRGDTETVRHNLEALRGARMDALAGVYESFIGLSATLPPSRGNGETPFDPKTRPVTPNQPGRANLEVLS